MFANTFKEINAAELSDWLNDSSQALRVIDVRQMEEIAGGTVPRAEALPLHALPEKIQSLSPEEKLVIVCRSGMRSAQACQFLQQHGFAKVYNLRGGMIGWVQSGFAPVQLA